MEIKALATDYDGTIAHHGLVEPATVDALNRLKESGRKVILVTGRELPDLFNVFNEWRIFDLIVAENGALLFEPFSGNETLLAESPPAEFADRLRKSGVQNLSVGRVIVATLENYISDVRCVIKEMNLDLEIILNKGSVMILPRGVSKATGLRAALDRLNLKPEEVAAVGDAENDHAMIEVAGFGVAVANALPELKQKADWTSEGDHGCGVRELIRKILELDKQPVAI